MGIVSRLFKRRARARDREELQRRIEVALAADMMLTGVSADKITVGTMTLDRIRAVEITGPVMQPVYVEPVNL